MNIDPLVYQAKFPERCRLDQCRSRCCRFGVWADAGEMKAILANRDLFLPYVRPESGNPDRWFGISERDPDCPSGVAVETRVIDGACAFLHPEHGCALQKGAIETGFHRWRFKPRFCVMFPLVLSGGTLTVDEEMKSLWCMREKNRTHPIAQAVRKELLFLFGRETARALLLDEPPSPKDGAAGAGSRVPRQPERPSPSLRS